MYKLIYNNRYQNQIYTKYDITFPEEDYGKAQDNVFCVADGVTRDLIGGEIKPYPQTKEEAMYIAEHYPNTSGAFASSKIIADNFIKYINEMNGKIDEQAILKAISMANKDVWEINKDRKIDYVGEDLYCSEAVGGAILDNILYCFAIGDCYIKVFDNDCKEIFTTENDHLWMEEFENEYLKSGEYNWMNPRYRLLMRAGLRNNYIVTHNGKKVGYGALTGEERAIDFVKIYKVDLKDAKYVCAFSDGCIPYFEGEKINKTLENPDEMIKGNGSERTLIMYKKI